MTTWWLEVLATWLPVSPPEFLATAFGLWSVWRYAREHLWSWPTGLIAALPPHG